MKTKQGTTLSAAYHNYLGDKACGSQDYALANHHYGNAVALEPDNKQYRDDFLKSASARERVLREKLNPNKREK